MRKSERGTRQGRSILLVAYQFPPCPDVGAHRPAAIAKYLRRLGHRVTVLTTSAYGRDAGANGEMLTRTADLRLLRARLRGRRSVRGIHTADNFELTAHPISYLAVPDRQVVAWVPFAVPAALALHRSRRFDVAITTAPPQSTQLVGRVLAARGCAWIADVRDSWGFEPVRPQLPTPVHERVDRWLERSLVRAADAVNCVSVPAADDIRRRFGVEPSVVPNGFDPELARAAAADAAGIRALLDPSRVSVVFTGRFGGYGRDPGSLIAALRELAATEPATAARLELVLAGPLRSAERASLTEGLSPLRVSTLGVLPRPRALALQHAADVLLLFNSPSHTQAAGAKLFEYMAAARPIIALTAGTEAGRIVTELGGEASRADDPETIKSAFRQAARGQLSLLDSPGISRYAYPVVAERMAELVEVAIERSSHRATARSGPGTAGRSSA